MRNAEFNALYNMPVEEVAGFARRSPRNRRLVEQFFASWDRSKGSGAMVRAKNGEKPRADVQPNPVAGRIVMAIDGDPEQSIAC